MRTLLVIIDGGVDQLLQILQTPFSFVIVLGFEGVLVTSVEDCGFDQVRYRRGRFVILGCLAGV